MFARKYHSLRWILFIAALVVALPLYASVETLGSADFRGYTRQIREKIQTADALPMCDTLSMMAVERKSLTGQVLALSLRLDHYFYKGDRQPLFDTYLKLQDFCREHGKKKFQYYYYSAWSNRLIPYYIQQNQFHAAIYEIRKMLVEAQQDNYTEAIAASYRILGSIFLAQRAYDRAADYYNREIALLVSDSEQDANLPGEYAMLARCLLELEKPDSAYLLLRKSLSMKPENAYQQFTVNKACALYNIQAKNFGRAKLFIDKIEDQFACDSSMSRYFLSFRSVKTNYLRAIGDYDGALQLNLSATRDSICDLHDFQYYEVKRELGDIYWEKADPLHAAQFYRDYIRGIDSVRLVELQQSTTTFSSILEVARLQSETKELQLVAQRRQLRSIYVIISLLVLVLLSVVFFVVRLMKLNNRLKASEAMIVAQNEDLTASGEELLHAKERAEEANRMKAQFLQSMSHEVRTPLNSIVGFSQVLASQFRKDESTCEYASIIESSSTNLLRLIDDVLDVSVLDQIDRLPACDLVELNSHCISCVNELQSEVKPGVAMIFEPAAENPLVQTNIKRVMQILRHLLHNAAKFTTRGEITLNYTCLSEQRCLRFTVTDTGCGVPDAQSEQIFERFVKLDLFSQGTGLGLPIARSIALKLGGTLSLDTTYKNGCRMILEVPFGENS